MAAAPGWKSPLAARLDALIADTVPGVRKAVKWNSPFYGAPGKETWFLDMHCVARYLKIAFFEGRHLQPMPPVASKKPNTRYLHVFEDGAFDERLFRDWIAQAVALPGTRL